MSIKRYRYDDRTREMIPSDWGDFVRYEEHQYVQSRVFSLEQVLRRLQSELKVEEVDPDDCREMCLAIIGGVLATTQNASKSVPPTCRHGVTVEDGWHCTACLNDAKREAKP